MNAEKLARMAREDPAGFLKAVSGLAHRRKCNGCRACADKCAGPIAMWREEAEAIADFAAAHGIDLAGPPDDEWQPCPFLEAASRRCLIYPVRPLICRLFGIVPWLPCPLARGPEPLNPQLARAIISAYASRPRRTLWAWLGM